MEFLQYVIQHIQPITHALLAIPERKILPFVAVLTMLFWGSVIAWQYVKWKSATNEAH